MINRLNIARTLIVLGFIAGLSSLWATFTHIGDPAYLVTADFGGGQAHSWYHALREAFGDLAAIIVVLFVMFASPQVRTPATWWICLILLAGYYLPFWAGMPFMEELAAPSLGAEINHISQALLSLAGLFYARREFFPAQHDAAG
ncbi:MAG: hypothetical protein WD601_06935 [Pseudohongiellaceae bacterium]